MARPVAEGGSMARRRCVLALLAGLLSPAGGAGCDVSGTKSQPPVTEL